MQVNGKIKKNWWGLFAVCIIALCLITTQCQKPTSNLSQSTIDFSTIPEYQNKPYVKLNDSRPNFSEQDLIPESFEQYSELDSLGRCGVAYACIGIDIMPTEERGNIGQVKPTGWHLVKYDNIDGNYLYNRCHLIGYQLSGENANIRNLITGTRYLNIKGMLPFENKVADYVKETKYHVLYRVTPVFKGDNLLASGVQIEAYSVEDRGNGICFNVYIYNVQQGITIDYATGESFLNENGSITDVTVQGTDNLQNKDKVWKSATGQKYHAVNDCGDMNPDRAEMITKQEAEKLGLKPCGRCCE